VSPNYRPVKTDPNALREQKFELFLKVVSAGPGQFFGVRERPVWSLILVTNFVNFRLVTNFVNFVGH
jgi:hypothetical protein